MDCLVLDIGYRPIRYISWKKAFSLWFSERAEVIEFHQDRFVRTTSEVYNIPSKIKYVRGSFYHKRSRKSARLNRKNVLVRDHNACQYCKISLETKSYTYDHVIPTSKGGKTSWDNIVACCKSCNQRKKDRTPEEAGMILLSSPQTPSIFDLQTKIQKGSEKC
jgi:5-methylcytosine-specific restriction endonuclease McrA